MTAPASQDSKIVSLADVREARTKQRTTPRENRENLDTTPDTASIQAQYTDTDDSIQVDTGSIQTSTSVNTAIIRCEERLRNLAQTTGLYEQNSPEEAAKILTGALILVRHIVPGEAVRVWGIINQVKTAEITSRILYHKSKPMLEQAGIWIKKPPRDYVWVNWKKPAERANSVRIDANDVQMEAGQGANDVQMPPATNPIDRFRNWQRSRYLERAKADIWMTVKPDGTVESVPKPGQGAMTEKQKELHRKAEWADHEARLKLRIDKAGNKELLQTIQREELQAIQQEKAILNQARIMAAEKRGQRQLLWVRVQPLVYIGVIGMIGLFLFKGGQQHPPIQQAAMPTMPAPPVQGPQQ